MISNQLVGYSRPSAPTIKPCGVCIKLLAAKIQNPDISVPIATIAVEARCMRLLTRPQPKSIIPKNEASKKKAVNTS